MFFNLTTGCWLGKGGNIAIFFKHNQRAQNMLHSLEILKPKSKWMKPVNFFHNSQRTVPRYVEECDTNLKQIE